MATVCKICAGPIEPPDQHDHCVACLGLAHAEAALVESDCGHCADLPARVLRTRRDMIRGLFGLFAAPPNPTEEGDDTMSISVSEREDWAGLEPDQTDSSGSPDLQEELMRVLSKAVQELELTWCPPEEPARSKLDSWSRTSGGRRGVPGGSARASGGARDVTLARRRLLSRRPDGLKRGGECASGPAPKRQKFMCSNVFVLDVHSIKMHTFSQKELFPPHSVNAAQSSAEPPPTQGDFKLLATQGGSSLKAAKRKYVADQDKAAESKEKCRGLWS
ncbi:hypothetical protein G5714_003577 [Onychostoma macrolepis]|uniref:Uncharacterized protein n=1 Tax=Onychostoma macrolepis TaxID=369639 RepID=A0A7J6D9W4_9TELE|nr:hypothetical protein G5714_003577 [Onychostoma macrolepis]